MNEADTPRVALLGCGHWGSNLARNFARLRSLAALHDPAAHAADALSTSLGVPSRTLEAILDDPQIDALAIATPPSTHAELALAALAAGKDVFVEKPLALHVADARTVVDRANELDRVLMVGHLLRYHPAFMKLESLVQEGTLGKLRYAYSTRLNFGRIRKVENILWSFSPHDLSMILALIGSEPTQVSAVGAAYLQQGINDVTTTHLSFPGGEDAHVFVSWLHPYKDQKLVVIGDLRMAVFDDTAPWSSKLNLYPHEVSWRDGVPAAQKAEGVTISVGEEEPLLIECSRFLECVVHRRRPVTDGEEATKILRILELAEASMSEQESMTTNPRRGNVRGSGHRGAFIHETAVVDPGVEIGAGTKVWHFSHILTGSRIGRDCVLGQNVMVGPDVAIGDRCKIQNNVSIYKGVALEDDVFCGPSVVFTNVKTPRAEVDRSGEFSATVIRKGATIGANATVVCGHEIGSHSFVGAGAVVTKDVPAHALVVGNPARQVGWVSAHGEVLGADMTCPASGRRYAERHGHLVDITDE